MCDQKSPIALCILPAQHRNPGFAGITLGTGTSIFSNFAALDLTAMPSLARGGARAHRAPLIVTTATRFRDYGRIVSDFARETVTIVTWPQPGWRPVVAGTGNEGGVVEDSFAMERRGEVQHAVNRAVGRSYVTGWFTDPAIASEHRPPTDTSRIYTHEANYHPDGGQIFWPRDGAAYVALLARPGDDVRPEDFVAFYCDGSFGIHINPGVWHQPVFPIAPAAVFDDKQGRVHACIAVNFVSEFGCYLEVPLVPSDGALAAI
jgi:ureidoglycolate lyase